MSASDIAHAERIALSDLLLEVGPDAPTLCEGWTTRDLTAHLVIREGRPDAALGILGGPLARHTESVQAATAQQPWNALVATVRSGPPRLSVFALPGVNGMANLLEFAIHHEDVRRAVDGWEPRDLPIAEQDAIWSRLGTMAKVLLRKSPVGVVLERTGTGQRIVAKKGEPSVTLTGDPLELVLRLYGRRQCRVEVAGESEAVARFESAKFGV
jgi:uncharacterized protein (TIGR03085 family)